MSIFQRSVAGTLRNRLRDVARTFSGEPPTPEETRRRLEVVLKARKELAGGQADLLRLLSASAVADALGDAERIAAYAESLAVESMINDAAGQTDRADALRRLAVAIARESQRRAPAPDAEIERLIAQDGRLDLADGSD
jgi:stage III sporulation protein SpoIIIAA